jgi:hypothetical protein
MRRLSPFAILGSARNASLERKRGKKVRRLTFEWVKVALATLTLVLLAVHAFTG